MASRASSRLRLATLLATLPAAGLALGIVGCTGEPSLLAVDLKTDMVPGVEIDEVRVEVLDGAGASGRFVETPVGLGEAWLEGRRAAELDDLEPGTITLRVTLSLEGREVVVRPLRVQLDGSMVTTVVITRDCVAVVCPAADGDPSAAACLRGECVPEQCTEENPCVEPECAADADCVTESACSVGRCAAGTCLFESPEICPAGGYCNPELGCVQPDWPAVAAALTEAAARGTASEPVIRTIPIPDLPGTRDRWVGGVLAPNGRIYGIPFDSNAVLEIDPVAGTATTFGTAASGRYVGGVLGPDGIIYALPYEGAGQILAIDPDARTVEKIGPDLSASVRAWTSPLLAPNGLIYGLPANETRVLVFDPLERTVSFLPTSLPDTGDKYRGAVLSPSGLIVGIPAQHGEVLVIDPMTNEVRTFGALPLGGRRWYGGVVTPEGRVLGLPLGATTVLEIDPLAETVVEVDTGATLIDTAGGSGALAPSGLVYRMPSDSPSVRELDPTTMTSRELGDLGMDGGKWIGGVLAPNGRIYGIPWNGTEVLEIDTSSVATLPMELLLSSWLNKL